MTPIKQALEALKECADDLEAELKSRYPADSYERYPSQKRRFDNDMAAVINARTAYEALSKYQEWVLVPREATQEMIEAAEKSEEEFDKNTSQMRGASFALTTQAERVYAAMLAAAKQHMEGE